MSLNFTQITELIDETVKTTADTYSLENKARDINLALDRFWAIAIPASGKWQLDDLHHVDHPIIYTDLVDGKRDYAFIDDDNGNLILDIYRVFAKNQAGVYRELTNVDQQTDAGESYTNGLNTEGIPETYDKTGNAIFIDPIPSYNSTRGLKLYINREASYFVAGDTSKTPGVAGIFHEYFVLQPSYAYAIRNALSTVPLLRDEVLRMENDIAKHYAGRERGTRRFMRPNVENTR